jgi:formate-dependent nitrite reductase cytochrome c552 subunit
MQTQRPILPTILRHGFLAAALVLVLVLVYTVQTRSTGIDDAKSKRAIKFSHGFHVKEAGVACIDCHVAATTSESASDRLLVEHPACQSCHEEQLGSNCTFCHMSDDTERTH